MEAERPRPTPHDEAHRHLYHPWWSVKEMEAISALAHRHHMNPVELIRDAVGGCDCRGAEQHHEGSRGMIPCSPYVLSHFPKPCKPRKAHWCRICGSRIAIGEPCCRWSSVEPGEGYTTSHAHPECYNITKGWDDGDWECHEPEGPREAPVMYWLTYDKADTEATAEAIASVCLTHGVGSVVASTQYGMGFILVNDGRWRNGILHRAKGEHADRVMLAERINEIIRNKQNHGS